MQNNSNIGNPMMSTQLLNQQQQQKQNNIKGPPQNNQRSSVSPLQQQQQQKNLQGSTFNAPQNNQLQQQQVNNQKGTTFNPPQNNQGIPTSQQQQFLQSQLYQQQQQVNLQGTTLNQNNQGVATSQLQQFIQQQQQQQQQQVNLQGTTFNPPQNNQKPPNQQQQQQIINQQQQQQQINQSSTTFNPPENAIKPQQWQQQQQIPQNIPSQTQRMSQNILPQQNQLTPQQQFQLQSQQSLQQGSEFQPAQQQQFPQQMQPQQQQQQASQLQQQQRQVLQQQQQNEKQLINPLSILKSQIQSQSANQNTPNRRNMSSQGSLRNPSRNQSDSFNRNHTPNPNDSMQIPLYGEPNKELLSILNNENLRNQNINSNNKIDSPPNFNYSDEANKNLLLVSPFMERQKSFDMDEYQKQPKIQLITMDKFYRIDLFKRTKLFSQLVELKEQGIVLSEKQEQMVRREEHIYNILSERRIEYLQYMDFLVPFLVLFEREIRDEIMEARKRLDQENYRQVLLRTRAEIEQYFQRRQAGEEQWNADVWSGEQRGRFLEQSSLGLIIFPSEEQARAQPLEGKMTKEQLMRMGLQQIIRVKTAQGVMEKWSVLYQFRLYVFVNASAVVYEQEIRLPLRFTVLQNERQEASFQLRSDESQYFIEVVLEQDLRMSEWYNEVVRQITLKQYYFILGRSGQSGQRQVIGFLENRHEELMNIHMDTHDCMLDDEVFKQPSNSILREVVFNFYSNIFYLVKLKGITRVIDLRGQKLPVFIMMNLMQEIDHQLSRCRLTTLILDDNTIDLHFIYALSNYLISPNSYELTHLSLTSTPVKDEGIKVIAQSFSRRHNNIRAHKFAELTKTANRTTTTTDVFHLGYQLPFLYLGLQNILISDVSIFTLCQAIQIVHETNTRNNNDTHDYTDFLTIDFSKNDITENAMRYLGGLLTKFNGIYELNLSKSYSLSAVYSEYFFDCLIENYSLQILDLTQIKIDEKFFKGIIKLLSNTCTLQKLKISYNENLDQYIANYSDKAVLRLLCIQQGYHPSISSVFHL